jgi:hypothetical protein
MRYSCDPRIASTVSNGHFSPHGLRSVSGLCNVEIESGRKLLLELS